VRHSSIALSIHRLEKESTPGAFAEVGVYKGELSRFLRKLAPGRTLHLFDTFAGFPQDALEEREIDDRFQDTSLEQVKRTIGDCTNLHFHQGFFPDTAAGVIDEKFAWVMLDLDKYKPTIAGLEFFYPRMVRGGYLFVHDYNSSESDGAIARAVDQFLADKPEPIIEIPDRCGSVMIRKM
jgi:O-methyltransferase